MAQIVFDPENELKPWRPLARFDMRSPALRQKQRELDRRKRQASAIAAADRDRKMREAQLADLSRKAAAARKSLQTNVARMREDAVAESQAEFAKLVRQKLRSKQAKRLAIIQYRAVRLFRVTLAELHGEKRSRDIVFARQFVMYWACRLTGLSLPRIGKQVGGRDHTTVLHGARTYPAKRAAQGRYLRPAR